MNTKRTKHTKRNALAIAVAPLLALVVNVSVSTADPVGQVEPNNEGPRVEDDAWYDVSEWFDGNDYNPTDEAIGRWDDETFDYADNRTSSDQDNDREVVDAEEFYGEDWDDGNGVFVDADKDGYYESHRRYHDSDGDQLNDSYATYRDKDGDGTYEDYDYSELSHKPDSAIDSSKVAQSTQEGLSGKAETLSGKITETKFVKRVGGMARMLKVDAGDDKSIWVDLGTTTAFNLFAGDSLTAMGPITKAGDKKVLVATYVKIGGKTLPIERYGRRYEGTIESLKEATVRGTKRTVAKLKTESGKLMTVDMGAASKNKKLSEGDEVRVSGVPVKIGDRVILIADQNSL